MGDDEYLRCIQADSVRSLQRAMAAGVRASFGSRDALIDDAVGQAWITLLENGGAVLKRFDSTRGASLATYCTMIAKNEARQIMRGDGRRKAREDHARRNESLRPDVPYDTLSVLTKTEHEFVADSLSGDVEHYSRSNRWQLTHRVRQKILAAAACVLLASQAFAAIPQDFTVRDRVDLLEVNHFHSDDGEPVFVQLVLWDFCAGSHRVVDWRLLKKSDSDNRLSAFHIQARRDYQTGDYVARWDEDTISREVRAGTFRETWTNWDVELCDRTHWPQERRRKLSTTGVRNGAR